MVVSMDSNICDEEVTTWRRCIERNLGDHKLEKKCSAELALFDRCIASWRLNGAKEVKIRGESEGEPPPQCAALSCLIGTCLRNTDYDFSRCKVPMQYFKHCVKSFYGSDLKVVGCVATGEHEKKFHEVFILLLLFAIAAPDEELIFSVEGGTMSFFDELTTGIRFDVKKHGAAMKRFTPENTKLDRPFALGNSTPICDIMEVPMPNRTLDIFGRSRSAGTSEGVRLLEGKAQGDIRNNATTAHTPVKSMSIKKKRNLWKKNELEVEGVDVPQPIEHFSELVRPPLSVDERLVSNLFERNHRIPTPIQMQAIPCLINKRDVLACAPTGSGKTLSFLIPMFHILKSPNTEAGVRGLIITPTMELAEQIEREAFFLMKGQRWKLVQHGQSTRNKDIFITTPRRVFTMIEKKLIDLGNTQYLVFDEVDRLWDSATDNLQVVDSILTACTFEEKVVALFTATLSSKIEGIARTVMSPDPIRIIVSGRVSANKKISQELVFCGNELGKIVEIRNLLREGISPPVLIFVQSIERTKELYDEIRCQGLNIAVMNSKMSHEERDETIMNFRLGKLWVIITTDLLSRGIDFKNIGTVINFDFPITIESYIHRIGRCGRAGKTGKAITFFTEDDKKRIPPIARVMKESGSAVEDWILEIKSDRRTRRRLERSTPHRMIVSTKKRMLVADQRMERQLCRLEKEVINAEDEELDGQHK